MKSQIKIGGGAFLTSDILSFKSKDAFIEAKLHLIKFHKSPSEYLEAIWNEAHKSDDFKVKHEIPDAASLQADDENTTIEPVKKGTKGKKLNPKSLKL